MPLYSWGEHCKEGTLHGENFAVYDLYCMGTWEGQSSLKAFDTVPRDLLWKTEILYKVMPITHDNWGCWGQWWVKVQFSMAKYTILFLSEKSHGQCWVWNCSNCKGSCEQDIEGALVGGCSMWDLQTVLNLPKSVFCITLHICQTILRKRRLCISM